jgi:hypothetical protein
MSTKDKVSKEWPDPKDYGLPFVELKTLSELKALPKTKADNGSPTIPVPPKSSTFEKPEVEKKDSSSNKPIKTKDRILSTSTSKTWVWVVLLSFIAISAVIFWQLTQGNLSQSLSDQNAEEFVSNVNPVQQDELGKSSKPSSASLPLDSAGVTTSDSTGKNSLAAAPKINAGKLILITSKAEQTRFFLIVASLPKEQLIREFASQLRTSPQEMYLIAPYASNPNYRLAIGKFESWKSASDELTRVKPQYAEDLWILNY